MNDRTCRNCCWWRYDLEFSIDGDPLGQCRRDSPMQSNEWPQVSANDFCGEWADKTITPEQEERRELVRRFAVALTSGAVFDQSVQQTAGAVWIVAQAMADAEPKP